MMRLECICLQISETDMGVFDKHRSFMSRVMIKPTIVICENKDADQLLADQRLCFRNMYSTIPLLSKSKLHRPVCVRPVRKPHCWFSHDAAHIYMYLHEKSCPKPKCQFFSCVTYFLAHLSRRLIGELIVYPCSGVRPSSVRPSSVVHNFKDLLL